MGSLITTSLLRPLEQSVSHSKGKELEINVEVTKHPDIESLQDDGNGNNLNEDENNSCLQKLRASSAFQWLIGKPTFALMMTSKLAFNELGPSIHLSWVTRV